MDTLIDDLAKQRRRKPERKLNGTNDELLAGASAKRKRKRKRGKDSKGHNNTNNGGVFVTRMLTKVTQSTENVKKKNQARSLLLQWFAPGQSHV